MKTKILASFLSAFAALSSIAAETVARFNAPTDGATSLGYTVAKHGSGGGFSITGPRSWDILSNTTVIVKYSGLPASGDQAIVTLAQSNEGDYPSLVGIASRNGNLYGVWKGEVWTDVTTGSMIKDSGTLVFVYRPSNSSGLTVYNETGETIYLANKLRSTSGSTTITTGERFDIGGTAAGNLSVDGFTVERVEIIRGTIASGDVAAAVAKFNQESATESFAADFPDGTVSGWASKWDSSTTAELQHIVGTNGAQYAYVVSSDWCPWLKFTAKTAYTLAVYGTVDQVQPTQGKVAILWQMGGKSNFSALVKDSDGNISFVQAANNSINKTLSLGKVSPGYHLFTVVFDSANGCGLYLDDGAGVFDDSFTTVASDGLQFGSFYGGFTGITKFERGLGFVPLAAWGSDEMLTPMVDQLAARFPAVAVNNAGSLYVPEIVSVGGITYSTLEEALAAVDADDTVITVLDDGVTYVDGAFTYDGATVSAADYGLSLVDNGDGTFTATLVRATTGLRISEIMPKPTDGVYDENGLVSGWIEFVNTNKSAWVDLAGYRVVRVNRGKKTDTTKFSNLAPRLVPPGGRTIVYTSESYPNGPYGVGDDSMFIAGHHDGITVESYPNAEFPDLEPAMVIPAKINPKKFCFVRLYSAPGAKSLKDKMGEIVDTVVIPSDLQESYSIVLGDVVEGQSTKRWICSKPTPGEENGTANLTPIGPNAGPLYENVDGAKHSSASEFARLAPPAQYGEDYVIEFSANPVMNPAGGMGVSWREEDTFTSIVCEYRIDLTNDVQTLAVNLDAKTTDNDWGDTYSATIPASVINSIAPGHLIQWRFKLTDRAGSEWTSPSFNNPDDGYEWYGTITQPDETLLSSKLTTLHLFAAPGVADTPGEDKPNALMNIDAADSRYDATRARVGIYDTSTSNYYDYVRIDLRGNSSKDFRKKSHGLRFAKAHPISTMNCVTGAKIPEVRKTSFIGEFCDPSELRQLLAFWFFNQHDSPAPYDFPVRLNLNGEFYQLGFMSQRFNDELIEDCYGLDPLGYGYKNIGPFTGTTSAGSVEKKTPDDGDESDLSVLNEFCATLPTDVVNDDPAYSKVVATKMDLPAWINYIALSRITHECDDVWANISGYYDNAVMKDGVRGSGTWRPLAYDMNLSFGQWYYNDVYKGTVEHDGPGLVANWDWFKSHPFYGGFKVRAHKSDGVTVVGAANRAYEAIFQNAKYRRLYLRRLRTLMDAELGAPGSDTYETSTLPLIVKLRELVALTSEDAALDRETWGQLGYTANGAFEVNVWGTQLPTNQAEAVADIWNNYIVPRREYLYVTHSATNTAREIGYGTEFNAGIPEAQRPTGELKGEFGIANVDLTGNAVTDTECLVITNGNAEAVDMSGWRVTGRFKTTFPAGTVIDGNGTLIVARDRRAYVTAHDTEIIDDIIIGIGTAKTEGFDATTTSVLLADDKGETVCKVEEPSNESLYLRFLAWNGIPKTDDDAGTGEWITLTNISDSVTLNLAGVNVKVGGAMPKCNITLESGTLAPGETITLKSEDFGLAKGWEKITNGKIFLILTDANGTVGQSSAEIAQKNFAGYDKSSAYLQVTRFDETFTQGDIILVEPTAIEVAPGEDVALEAATLEEATAALAGCEIALSAEDTAAGLTTNVLKLVALPIEGTDPVTGDPTMTYIVKVTVDEAKVPAPVLGEITEDETAVAPLTVTKEGETSTVAVGVNNATTGLWYGFEVSETLGPSASFSNDAGSFRRATVPTVKVTATPRSGGRAFYRIKVEATKPQTTN